MSTEHYDRQQLVVVARMSASDREREVALTALRWMTEAEHLRTVVRRLLDGWVIGDNCDPTDPPELEFAWERGGWIADGVWEDQREPFEPGVDELLRSFDPPESTQREQETDG